MFKSLWGLFLGLNLNTQWFAAPPLPVKPAAWFVWGLRCSCFTAEAPGISSYVTTMGSAPDHSGDVRQPRLSQRDIAPSSKRSRLFGAAVETPRVIYRTYSALSHTLTKAEKTGLAASLQAKRRIWVCFTPRTCECHTWTHLDQRQINNQCHSEPRHSYWW